MKIIKKALGKALYGITKVLSLIFDGLIRLVENMIVYSKIFFKGCLAIASMGGCLFFLLFANLGLRILVNPIGLFTVLFLLSFLMFGSKFIASLRYQKYTLIGYLLQTAQFLMDKDKYQYQPFNHFREAYLKAEEERIREEQRRYYEQQRQWEERVKQQWYQHFQQHTQSSYHGQGTGHGYVNAEFDFKNQYEKSCHILEIPYDADQSIIKSAYRKKAKQYHPDLCNLPDATKRFQEVSKAYEFLNDGNRQRYQRLKNC